MIEPKCKHDKKYIKDFWYDFDIKYWKCWKCGGEGWDSKYHQDEEEDARFKMWGEGCIKALLMDEGLLEEGD